MHSSKQQYTELIKETHALNESGVWIVKGRKAFNYSDGDEIENRLLEQIQSAVDVSLASNELQQLISDWPSEYHYTPQRANILSPFKMDGIDTVLEIGSGCGAVTRYLGEQGKQVLALEGSERRASITKARCRDLDNVTVCCDSFDTFSTQQTFDCVTFVGVLEYSPAFISGHDPIVETLRKARALLNEGGVLIVAIENQLGLKYFNGCTEDHSGQPFTGINDNYAPGTYCTFGRVELADRLTRAGFTASEFMYPFPDYKLPQLLIREEAFETKDLNLANIIGQYDSRDYAFSGERVFHENRTWPLVAQNDLVRDLANSFLVFAYNDKQNRCMLTEPWLIKTYSCPRKKEYLTSNTFYKSDGNIRVLKQKVYPAAKTEQGNCLVELRIGEELYATGSLYPHSLQKILHKANILEEYANYLKPWIDYLLLESSKRDKSESGLMIPGGLLDCIPANLIIGRERKITLIDQEWKYQQDLDIGFVIFRGIFRDVKSHLNELTETLLLDNRSIFDLMQYVFNLYGITLDHSVLKRYIDQEIDLQLAIIVYPTTKKELVDYLSDFCLQKRTRKLSFGELLVQVRDDDLRELYVTAKELQQDRDRNIHHVGELEHELLVMRNCWSWKIGRFITAIPRFFLKKH